MMALFRIRPTHADIEIAERISERTGPEIEQLVANPHLERGRA
jgi:hypothetical protein